MGCEEVKGRGRATEREREKEARNKRKDCERMTRESLAHANRAAVSWWCQLDSSDDLYVWSRDTFAIITCV